MQLGFLSVLPSSCFIELMYLMTRLLPAQLKSEIKDYQRRVREWRYSLNDLGFAEWLRFRRARASRSYKEAFDDDTPLVTICVATYNRAELLTSRCLPSLLRQTYRNIEIIVVGDGCSDRTPELMQRIADPRVRFVNLPQRGVYPDHPYHRWMVAGTAAVNVALSMAKGQFITHLDDDDEHREDRVETLLQLCQRGRHDIVWHPFEYEDGDYRWSVNDASRFAFRKISTSSVFYHHYFKKIPWDVEAWRREEPGDWNRFRKFRFLGVRAARHPELLLKHYRERNQAAS
jgi:glycosyltransferase involved in cell wall biosynthesis